MFSNTVLKTIRQ